MKPRLPLEFRVAGARRGFTLIEITIALAVVAFALVAIVGVLPIGLNVQRDNRAETIAHHDGNYWMEVLRGGTAAVDDLDNYVELIVLERASGNPTVIQTFDGGRQIVGLLGSMLVGNPPEVTNVYAVVRSITGVASEKPGSPVSPNTAGAELAFKYRLQVQILRAGAFVEDFNTSLGLAQASVAPPEPLDRLHDIRLRLSWPVVRSDPVTGRIDVGRRHKTFRSMAARDVLTETNLAFLVP